MFDYLEGLRYSLYRLCSGGVDVAIYGRRQLSHPPPEQPEKARRQGKGGTSCENETPPQMTGGVRA